MRIDVLKTLIQKETKEYVRNQGTKTMFIISVFMIVMMGSTGGKNLITTIIMPMTFLGLYIPGFLIAEEKEKRTLGALLVSPASALEIIFGKLFLCAAITYVTTFSLVAAYHSSEVGLGVAAIALLATTFFVCFIGAVIGLVSPSQALVSTIGTILMMLFMLAEMLQPLSNKVSIIARALPTHQSIQALIFSQTELTEKVLLYTGTSAVFFVVLLLWLHTFLKDAGKQESESWKWTMSQKAMTGVLLAVMVAMSLYLTPAKTQFTEGLISNSELKYSLSVDTTKWEHKESWFGRQYSIDFNHKKQKDLSLYLVIKAKEKGETLSSLKEKYKKEDGEDKNVESKKLLLKQIGTRQFLLRQIVYKNKSKYRLTTEGNGYFYSISGSQLLSEEGLQQITEIENFAASLEIK